MAWYNAKVIFWDGKIEWNWNFEMLMLSKCYAKKRWSSELGRFTF